MLVCAIAAMFIWVCVSDNPLPNNEFLAEKKQSESEYVLPNRTVLTSGSGNSEMHVGYTKNHFNYIR